ncbi:hypothetical protein KHA90_23970 [Flavobacterium psychroterrae]|uniref:Holin n=1 Tax=Flavobacterium psychroterrae TaxID=2133767 RepID=A0ABS5PKQ9_9FLAO|nr:hypothetical protein [Flavobacterium psychroterrae]MBS7234066.1 hypothetical protein [Flavobacterium psychroterrae]
MEQIVYPTLTVFFTALITWFFSRRKNIAEVRSAEIDNDLKLKSAELDNDVKAAKHYRDILDDFATRLTTAYDTIKAMEIQHRELMLVNQQLVDELQKFKQLNGKPHDTTK